MTSTASIVKTSSNVFSFSVFFGMALVAFMALIALSPISYEQYASYRDQQDNSGQAQVAGVSSEPESLEIFNLLDRSDTPFQYEESDNNASLSASFNNQGLKHKYEWLELLKVNNNSYATDTIYLRFDSRAMQPGISYDLHSPEGIMEKTGFDEFGDEYYEMSIQPGVSAKVVLIREAQNSLNTEPLYEQFDVLLQTSEKPFTSDYTPEVLDQPTEESTTDSDFEELSGEINLERLP